MSFILRPWQLFLVILAGWINRQQQEVPDVLDRKDPWGAFEGRKGGMLAVYRKADGEQVAQYQLDKPPIFEGLAAARGRLYVITTDGRIVCMGEVDTK